MTYTWMESLAIHEIVFEKSDRRASQESLEKIMHIFNEAQPDQTMRLLLDFRKTGFMPMNNVVSQAKQWRKNVHNHPQTSLAILMMPNSALTLLQPILNLMRFGHLETKMFQGEKREPAIAWLVKTK